MQSSGRDRQSWAIPRRADRRLAGVGTRVAVGSPGFRPASVAQERALRLVPVGAGRGIWPPLEPFRAACWMAGAELPDGHRSPVLACSCGIYASRHAPLARALGWVVTTGPGHRDGVDVGPHRGTPHGVACRVRVPVATAVALRRVRARGRGGGACGARAGGRRGCVCAALRRAPADWRTDRSRASSGGPTGASAGLERRRRRAGAPRYLRRRPPAVRVRAERLRTGPRAWSHRVPAPCAHPSGDRRACRGGGDSVVPWIRSERSSSGSSRPCS